MPESPFSKVQMSSLLRNPDGKRQPHKWRRHSLTARSVLELEGNDGSPIHSTSDKAASLKPVYFFRMIHQHFPVVSLMITLRGRSVPFMTNMPKFWQEHRSLLWRLTTASVFRCHGHQGLSLPFLLLGYKNSDSGNGRQEKS